MTYKGIAAFAAMNKKFPIRKVLSAYPKDIKYPATAILYEFFGDNWKFPEKFCKKFADRIHLIEWHLCFRNSPGINELKKRIKRIIKKMNEIGNENTRMIVCPILEDKCSDSEFQRIANGIQKVIDNPTEVKILGLVRNPCLGGKKVGPYTFEEHHGDNPRYKKAVKNRIYNPDGTSVNFNDGDKYFNQISIKDFESILNKNKGMFLYLIWIAALQGFKNCKSFNDVPPLNKRKYILTRKAKKGCKQVLKEN